MSPTHMIPREACPVCTHDAFRSVLTLPYYGPPILPFLERFYGDQGVFEPDLLAGAVYDLCECDKCRSLFQRQIPNEAFMERLYSTWIDPELSRTNKFAKASVNFHISLAEELASVVKWLGSTPSDLHVLDFGMGWGKWSLMAKAFGCQSYGTELSEEKCRHADRLGIRVVDWNDIPDLRLDFINTEQVFEHIPAPFETLVHLSSGLRPGGVIRISVPSVDNIDQRIQAADWQARKGSRLSLNPVSPLEHINYFRPSSFSEMALEAGLKLVKPPAYTLGPSGQATRFIRESLGNLKRSIWHREGLAFFQKPL